MLASAKVLWARMAPAVSLTHPVWSACHAQAVSRQVSRVGHRPTVTPVSLCAQAAAALTEAKQKFDGGDRLQAMKLYEDALNEVYTRSVRDMHWMEVRVALWPGTSAGL